MTEPTVVSMPLPDAGARRRIQEELDTNLLVEAGAGSGKTTELVNRMAELLATGTATVDEIAAVTFTRKAAGELRERLQGDLERRVLQAAEAGDEEVRDRLRAAVEEIDRAFVGTIHAFCARLLRERPLDVGLDPAFTELPAEEQRPFRKRYWESYLERLVRERDPLLEELSAAGLRPAHLYGLFEQLVENPDIAFPSDDAQAPAAAEIGRVRSELQALVERGVELMPAREPDPSWDSLQQKVRTLAFTLEVTGWTETADFFEALDQICKEGNGHRIVQKRWRDKALAKAFCERMDAFSVGPDAPANRLLHRWYAHRYALGLRLARQASVEFAEHRRRSGVLDFQDLLLLTARLLRSRPGARRELGERYRRLLVDEFQDTDPLQAEIMFLLASDPGDDGGGPSENRAAGEEHASEEGVQEEGGEGDGVQPHAEGGDDTGADAAASDAPADWRTAVPRPGALFVVGDPKQSIYRFRRADIQLYEMVKGRFARVGEVVELTANFRSRPAIGDLVNELFSREGFFPGTADAEQASFEPLNTRPPEGPLPVEGVFWYGVHPDGTSRPAVTEDDAARLASWIRARVEAGERSPGDFMILTRTTHYLDAYARALEERSVPVQVTGAGVGISHELEELVALLECMVDPSNPVKVVAVLVGLFFGLDLERLTAHRLDGGALDAVRPGTDGDPEVLEALATLHRWFGWASTEPADVFVTRVVSELGLLPYAAAGELGSMRAGALLFALDSVRAAALSGEASLPGALDALRNAVTLSEAEAPLEPGRPDVVRLMNLHQAKGLEANVVILADPSRQKDYPPTIHVERDADGQASGWLRVTEATEGWGKDRVVARPLAWEEKRAVEERFERAEQVRLLYVAVTRAREELVVGRWPGKEDGSVWSALDPWITEHAEELELPVDPPEPRAEVELTPGAVQAARTAAAERLEAMAVPSWRHVSVTEVAKKGAVEPSSGGEGEGAPPAAGGGGDSFRGYSWGSAVHGALAAAAEEPSEAALVAACRGYLVEHDRPLDDHGEPVELQELVELVHAVRASELWARARSAERLLAEVPFAAVGVTRPPAPPAPEPEPAAGSGGPRRQLDLFGAALVEGTGEAPPPAADGDEPEEEAVRSVLEGVVDLAFQEEDGWVIADYKTDVGTDPEFPERVVRYRRQVELYADAWARLTGEPVKERVLYFTAQDRVESW